jgi:uncharacterized protein
VANIEFPVGPGNLPTAGLLTPLNRKEDKKMGKAGKAGAFSRLFAAKAKEDSEVEGLLGEGLPADDGGIPLDKLLDGVTELGDELKKNASLETIKAYKNAVRRFMARVVRDSFRTEEKVTGLGFKKRKKYIMIKVIDEKLERLAMGILQHQSDQLEILRRLDEIRGLLVDLTQ